MPDAQSAEIIKKMPKTEAHLHMEGAIPYRMLRSLDPEKYSVEPESWRGGFRFSSFSEFDEALLGMVLPWFNSPERYGEAARAVLGGLFEKNVRYVETSFASGVLQFLGVDGRATAEAIKGAAPEGMEVRVYMGIHHDGHTPEMEGVFADALSWECLDGIDLHGDEKVPLGGWAREYWGAARKAGKLTKAHAGELCGPGFVRRVIDELGVSQIEHGIRAAEDPALAASLAESGVSLDVCPTSNVKLRAAPSYASHPLRALREAGVLCTVNSDDPVIFGSDILGEYGCLMDEMGFTLSECAEIACDGWRAAKVSDAMKREMISGICELAGISHEK